MADSEKPKTGFSGCEYLKYDFFKPIGEQLLCKKKKTHEFNCTGCPYRKIQRRDKW